jgi:hypothetical protein
LSALLTGANVLAGTVAFFWAATPPSGTTEDRLPADIFMRFSLAAAAIIIVDGLVLASRPGTRRAGFGVLLGGIATLAIIVGVISLWALHAYGDD